MVLNSAKLQFVNFGAIELQDLADEQPASAAMRSS
jgi:hypothetical protein